MIAENEFRPRVIAAIALALTVMTPRAGAAVSLRDEGADPLVVAAGEVVDDDLYILGRTVDIAGTVRGDLVVVASVLRIHGRVTGGVFAICSDLEIDGEVDGSVHVLARTAGVRGTVRKDFLAAAEHAVLAPAASIGRDVSFVGSDLKTDGAVIGGQTRKAADSPVDQLKKLLDAVGRWGALLVVLIFLLFSTSGFDAASAAVKHRPVRSLLVGLGLLAGLAPIPLLRFLLVPLLLLGWLVVLRSLATHVRLALAAALAFCLLVAFVPAPSMIPLGTELACALMAGALGTGAVLLGWFSSVGGASGGAAALWSRLRGPVPDAGAAPTRPLVEARPESTDTGLPSWLTRIRWAGVVAVVLVVVFWPPPPYWRDLERPGARYLVFQSDVVARAQEWGRTAEALLQARCTAVTRLGDTGEGLQVQIACPANRNLTVMLQRRDPGYGSALPVADCLAGTAAGQLLRCSSEGSMDDSTRAALLVSLRQASQRIAGDKPFVTKVRWPGLTEELRIELGVATILLVSFLWLAATGFFGYGSSERRDWVALIPLVVALAVRFGWTFHSIEAVDIQFATHWELKHSVTYPLLQLSYAGLAPDPVLFTIGLNGLLGSLAVLPAYLFVRQSTRSRLAGFTAALVFAAHPIIARFAPTDGPYSLLLVSWMAGLALLSTDKPAARTVFGGIVLLGVAASLRLEGSIYLLGSLFMLGIGHCLRLARQHFRATVLGLVVVAGLITVQMLRLLRFHEVAFHNVGKAASPDWLANTFLSPQFRNPALAAALGAGMLAGIFIERWRVGLGLLVATLLAFWLQELPDTWTQILSLHYGIIGSALQSLLAGVGVAYLCSLLPSSVASRVGFSVGTLLAVSLFWPHRAFLREHFWLGDEYELLRAHLGKAEGDLLLTASYGGDADLDNFGWIVPHENSVRCQAEDCVAKLTGARHALYLRSVGCYDADRELKGGCPDGEPSRSGCLRPVCQAIEDAALLRPIDERRVTLPWHEDEPRTVTIGLYEAEPRSAGP